MPLPIETPRLLLRNLQDEDWPQVHAYARDLEVVRYADWGPNSEAETRAFIGQAIAARCREPRREYHLAAIFKDTGALVGNASLVPDPQDARAADLGCTLHRLAWGQGLGTEVATALVEFGFLHLELRRIGARCRPENIAAYRVMKKAGLRFEEYLQNDRTKRGRQVDSFLCGVSRADWLARASAGPGRDC